MQNIILLLCILMLDGEVGLNIYFLDDFFIEMVFWIFIVVGVCDFFMYGKFGLIVMNRLGY